MVVDVVLGMQYGDEGKGKVTHHLAREGNYDFVLRFNGGGNAGHTIYHEGKKVVTHYVPAGVFYGIPSLIGPGCVVNPQNLIKEIQDLEESGIKCRHLVKVANNCHVITEDHVNAESNESKIGTTRTGNGPAYAAKYGRTGITAAEVPELQHYVFDFFEDFLCREDVVVLAEGAQGFSLDIDFGSYPFVTSSHVTLGGLMLSGISPKSIRSVYGVAKVYETYVGAMQFQNPNDKMLTTIGDVGNEYGATTGRRRQVSYLDLNRLFKAVKINHPTTLIFNKLDVLREVDCWIVNDGKTSIKSSSEREFTTVIKTFVESAFDNDIEIRFSDSPQFI